MTIVVSSARASTLSTDGESNNAFITREGAISFETSGTYATDEGTEVNAAENATSESTFDFWSATATGAGVASWRATFSTSRGGTIFAIAKHNIGTLGGTVRVQYSDDSGSTWTDSGAGPVTPTDDQPIAWRFASQTHVDWRVRVTGVAGSAEVSIAVCYVGFELIIPQRIYQGFAPVITPTIVDLNTNVTEGANYVASAFTERGSTLEAEFTHIEPSFIRGSAWPDLQTRWNKGFPAFIAWRPTKYGDLHYAWRAGSAIRPVNSGPKDYMSFSIAARLIP